MTIVYSAIARAPSTVLCSHQIGDGNFDGVTRDMVPNIPTQRDTKITYTANNYLFHVVIQNGIIFMCAADQDFGRRLPYGYLDAIRKQFMSGPLASRAQFATDGELNRDFSQVMANQMEKFSRSGGGGDHIDTVQAQVEEVKGVMTQNIEKVLERGERLDELMTKTEDLESHSATFKKSSRQLHHKMWCKNLKMKLILIAVVTVILLVVILIILFSTHVLPPKKGGGTTTVTPTTTTTHLPLA